MGTARPSMLGEWKFSLGTSRHVKRIFHKEKEAARIPSMCSMCSMCSMWMWWMWWRCGIRGMSFSSNNFDVHYQSCVLCDGDNVIM